MDSAAWGEGRYRSCAGVKAWSVLLSYFCHSVAFQAYKCTHPITSLFIHPLIDTSVVSMSWLLLNNAAMNMEVKIYFWVRVLFRQIPRSGIKAMAPHSNTLAWKIPWMEEPGALQTIGSCRVEHDWSNLAAAGAASRADTGFLHTLCFVHYLPVYIHWGQISWRDSPGVTVLLLTCES